jgi:hypothetical protein
VDPSIDSIVCERARTDLYHSIGIGGKPAMVRGCYRPHEQHH